VCNTAHIITKGYLLKKERIEIKKDNEKIEKLVKKWEAI